MNANRMKRVDSVRVDIADADGKTVYSHRGNGYHNVIQAIAAAYAAYKGDTASYHPTLRADQSLEEHPSFFHYYRNPDAAHNAIENYVFTVTDLTSGTSERYRVNAGGHVRLIPEETMAY